MIKKGIENTLKKGEKKKGRKEIKLLFLISPLPPVKANLYELNSLPSIKRMWEREREGVERERGIERERGGKRERGKERGSLEQLSFPKAVAGYRRFSLALILINTRRKSLVAPFWWRHESCRNFGGRSLTTLSPSTKLEDCREAKYRLPCPRALYPPWRSFWTHSPTLIDKTFIISTYVFFNCFWW